MKTFSPDDIPDPRKAVQPDQMPDMSTLTREERVYWADSCGYMAAYHRPRANAWGIVCIVGGLAFITMSLAILWSFW